MAEPENFKKFLEEFIRELTCLLQTPEGQKAIDKAAQDAASLSAEKREKRRVEPVSIYRRVTL